MKCLRALSIVSLTVLTSLASGAVEGRMVDSKKPQLKITTSSQKKPFSHKSNVVRSVDITKYHDVRGGDGMPSELIHRIKVGFYFSLWYALNVVYNSTYCIGRFMSMYHCHTLV
jgi:hypothetical protein